MKITIKVAAIISNSENKFLLIKEQYHQKDGLKWNFIKGTFDNANETLSQCIEREIREEVCLDVENIKLWKIFQYGNNNNPRILFVFRAESIAKFDHKVSFKNQKFDENIIQANWFSLDELVDFSKDDLIAPYVHESIQCLLNSNEEMFKKI